MITDFVCYFGCLFLLFVAMLVFFIVCRTWFAKFRLQIWFFFYYFLFDPKMLNKFWEFVYRFLGPLGSPTPDRSGNPGFLGLCHKFFESNLNLFLISLLNDVVLKILYFFYDCFSLLFLWFMLLLFTGKIASVSGTLGIFRDSIRSHTTHAQNFNYFLKDWRFSVVFWKSGLLNFGVGSFLVRVYFWFLRLGGVFSDPKSHVHLQYMWFIPKPGWNYFNFSPFYAFEIDLEKWNEYFWFSRYEF